MVSKHLSLFFKEMTFNNKQFISTTAGNCILDSDNLVQIEINKKEYIKKKLRDVNVGDMVLFKKDCINKTLKEVEEAVLEKEPRYMHAKEVLHEVNNVQRYIPKFRTLLIRGVLNSQGEYNKSLEDKILKQNGEFSKEDYTKMGEKIESVIKEKGMEPLSFFQHRNWVKGGTVAPDNWDYFRALESINSEFKEWDSKDSSLVGKYFSYRYYNAARRCLMSKIARCKGLGKGPRDKENSNEGNKGRERIINLKPLLRELEEHFFREKDKQYLYARVTNISSVFKKNQQDCIEKTNTNLTKGVVTFGLINGEEETKEKSYDELLDDEHILYSYFRTLIEKGHYQDKIEELDVKHLHNGDRLLKMQTAIPYLLEWFGGIDPFMKQSKEDVERWWKSVCKHGGEHIEEITNAMKKVILEGEIDESWNLKKGTAYNLLKVVYQLKAAIPASIHKYDVMCKSFVQEAAEKYEKMGFNLSEHPLIKDGNISALPEVIEGFIDRGIFPDSETKYEYNKLVQKQKEIGEEFKIKFSGIKKVGGIKGFLTTSFVLQNADGTKVEKSLSALIKEKRMKGDLNYLKEEVYSREHIQNALKKYGFEDIIDVRKDDFLLDGYKKSFKIKDYVEKIKGFFKKKT